MKDSNYDYRTLADLVSGETATITKIKGHGAFRHRIIEMGFIRGKKVRVVKNAPLLDPIEYEIMGYNVSLRRSEAELIEVVPLGSYDAQNDGAYSITESDDPHFQNNHSHNDSYQSTARITKPQINIALVGNPNSGKTTLYNFISGAREKVGNYTGVTVDATEKDVSYNDYRLRIADLPGTYSITEYTPEELYVRRYINEQRPDIIVNVVDTTNLERNLYLTMQLIDMNVKVIIALNMYDEFQRTGGEFDYITLGKMLGVPIVPTIASRGMGIDNLLQKIVDVFEDKDPILRHVHINYGRDIEEAIELVKTPIKNFNPVFCDKYYPRGIAIKLLEKDNTTLDLLKTSLGDVSNFSDIQKQTEIAINKLEENFKEKSDSIIADARYGFIAGALKETFKEGVGDNLRRSAKIDAILTNRILAFPIFFVFIWLMFQVTFSIGAYPVEWLETGMEVLGGFCSKYIPEGILRDVVVDGVIGGVGSVIVFLPNIVILFLFISFMEDTGYMARAAFIMDKIMHRIGLHGRSFIPLIMGFGCNVPAILATRTLNSKKDRIITMMMIPFMSCSARLPVYVLLVSAFFVRNQGLVLISLYVVGAVVGVITALIAGKIVGKNTEAPFVMELPPYRIPTLRNTFIHTWDKSVQYLKKMGGFILVASVVIWALNYFPTNPQYSKNYDAIETEIINASNISVEQKDSLISNVKMEKQAEKQENSYIGYIGKAIEPIFAPLGFDWKVCVSIFTGFFAKEVVVSTLGVLYGTEATDEDSAGLQVALSKSATFNPLVAYTLMLFVLLYIPCVATILAIKKEAGRGIATVVIIYNTAVAYIISLVVYRVGLYFL